VEGISYIRRIVKVSRGTPGGLVPKVEVFFYTNNFDLFFVVGGIGSSPLTPTIDTGNCLT